MLQVAPPAVAKPNSAKEAMNLGWTEARIGPNLQPIDTAQVLIRRVLGVRMLSPQTQS